MIKELIINTILTLFIFFWVFTNNIYAEKIVVKRIGRFDYLFERMLKEWEKETLFQENKNITSEQYVLIESGSVNFKDYQYILFDFTKKNIKKGKRIIFTKELSLEDEKKLQQALKSLSNKNNIYDGSAALKDGTIYIFRYYNKKEIYNFGSYGKFLGEKYSNKLEKQIAKSNLKVFELFFQVAEDAK